MTDEGIANYVPRGFNYEPPENRHCASAQSLKPSRDSITFDRRISEQLSIHLRQVNFCRFIVVFM